MSFIYSFLLFSDLFLSPTFRIGYDDLVFSRHITVYKGDSTITTIRYQDEGREMDWRTQGKDGISETRFYFSPDNFHMVRRITISRLPAEKDSGREFRFEFGYERDTVLTKVLVYRGDTLDADHTYRRDGQGRVEKVEIKLARGPKHDINKMLAYDAGGRLKSIVEDSTSETRLEYDPSGFLVGRRAISLPSGDEQRYERFSNDSGGRMLKVEEVTPVGPGAVDFFEYRPLRDVLPIIRPTFRSHPFYSSAWPLSRGSAYDLLGRISALRNFKNQGVQ